LRDAAQAKTGSLLDIRLAHAQSVAARVEAGEATVNHKAKPKSKPKSKPKAEPKPSGDGGQGQLL
jgi:hypothetical protein